MTITQRIFDIMEKKGISQAQLSSSTGISTSAISAWKTKNTFPTADKIPKIAECLGVPVAELYNLWDEASKANNVVTGSSNTIQNGNNNVIELRAEGALTINNPAVAEAYESLTEREKLSVQMFILDTAEAKKKEKEKKD